MKDEDTSTCAGSGFQPSPFPLPPLTHPVQRTGAGTTNPGWVWVRLPHGVLETERGEAWLSHPGTRRSWVGARGDQPASVPVGARMGAWWEAKLSKTRLFPVRMAGLEPTIPCSRNTRVCRYPTSRSCSPVRTAGFEPAIPWPPTRCDNQASPRSGKSQF